MKKKSSAGPPVLSMSLSRSLPLLPGFLLGSLYLILVFVWSPAQGVEQFCERSYSLRLTDRKGHLLQILPLQEGLRREFVPLEELPEDLIDLLVQAEDSRFFLHPGVDPLAMMRALIQFVGEGEVVSGGSTITMQLARIINPHPVTTAGKLKEMVQAVWLEIFFSKNEILELWVNNVPYGRNVEGITSASLINFGTTPAMLSRGEMAVMAILPRSPGLYDPRALTDSHLIDRVYTLLKKLDLAADLTQKKLEEDILRGNRRAAEFRIPDPVPHFVAYVRKNLSPQDWVRGGTVSTSLDLDMQQWLETELNHIMAGAEENRIHNGAALVLDNRTGEILAYVGSQDFSGDQGQVDGIMALGQPGSTMKPFLYALALDRGMTPATILPDVPLLFGSREVYTPENFNNRFNGPVRLRTALASSLNIPAVYTLERVGTAAFIEKLKQIGFDSLLGHEGSLGTGIALGNADLTLYELTAGFALFPRYGETLIPRWQKNDTFQAGQQVYSPRSAALIVDILTDRAGRVTGFGQSSRLDTNFPAMFKTGTSNQFNDIWALGATTDLTCGVWMGNFSGETVIGRPGSSLPAEVSVSFLREYTRGTDFRPPPEVRTEKICALSGQRAGPYCEGTLDEYIPVETELQECSFHQSQEGIVTWPAIYHHWREGTKAGLGSMALNESEDEPILLHPPSGSLFYLDSSLPGSSQVIRIEIASPGSITLFVDDTLLVREAPPPLILSHPLERGIHTIRIESAGQILESSYQVR